ncbi:MAG: hypothetical protein ACTSXK_17295 [Promethearchaeota archaeon]
MDESDITKKFEEIKKDTNYLNERIDSQVKILNKKLKEKYDDLNEQISKNSILIIVVFGAILLYSSITSFLDSSKINHNEYQADIARQEATIAKALVENKAISHDINNDGQDDYIFKNEKVYIYNPSEENYLETTVFDIKEGYDSKFNSLKREIDSLELNKEALDRLQYNKIMLDSVYNKLKK